MRSLAIVLALGLIGATVAVLLGPRLLNRPEIQAELRRVAEAATGTEVVVRGRIGIDVLPRPRLNLVRVSIQSIVEGVALDADRLDLQLAPLDLARGRLTIREVRLIRPRLSLTGVGADDVQEELARVVADGTPPDLDAITVVDGRIDVVDGAGAGAGLGHLRELDAEARREPAASHIALTASAETATGEPVQLQAELREPDGGGSSTVHVELTRGPESDLGRVDFRGFGSLAAETPSLRGSLTVEAASLTALGRLLEPIVVAPLPPVSQPATPIALTGRLDVDDQAVRLSEIDLKMGAAQLTGAFGFVADTPPRLDIALEASEVAADGLLDEPIGAAFRALTVPDGLTGHIGLRSSVVRWRGRAAREARIELALDGGGIAVERASLQLPGGGQMSLVGRIDGQPDRRQITGRLSASADDLNEAVGFLVGDGQKLPPLPRALDAVADLTIDSGGVRLTGIDGRLGTAAVRGAAGWTYGPRPRLDLAIRCDRWMVPLGVFQAVDPATRRRLLQTLRAVDVDLDIAVERTSLGLVRADHGRLRASLEGSRLRLDELSVGSLEDARLSVVGDAALDGGAFTLAAELAAPRPTPLLRAIWPGVPATALRFGPVDIAATLNGNGEGTSLDIGLDANGVQASIQGSTGARLDLDRLDLVAELKLQQPWAALRHAGLASPLLEGPPGPARARARLQRNGRSGTLTIDASFAGGGLETALALSGIGGHPRLDGKVTVPRLDPPLLATLRQLVGDRLPAEIASPSLLLGRLPTQPLPWRWLSLADADLAVDMRGIGDLSFAARLIDGRLAISDLTADLAGGRLGATLTLDAAEAEAALGAQIDLTGARAGEVLGGLGFGPGVDGLADLHLQLAGSGRSLAEIVGDLDGRGRIELDHGAITTTPQPSSPRGAHGELAIEHGTLTTLGDGLTLTYPEGAGRLGLRLDLQTWIAEMVLAAGVPADAHPLSWSAIGPPGRLQTLPPR